MRCCTRPSIKNTTVGYIHLISIQCTLKVPCEIFGGFILKRETKTKHIPNLLFKTQWTCGASVFSCGFMIDVVNRTMVINCILSILNIVNRAASRDHRAPWMISRMPHNGVQIQKRNPASEAAVNTTTDQSLRSADSGKRARVVSVCVREGREKGELVCDVTHSSVYSCVLLVYTQDNTFGSSDFLQGEKLPKLTSRALNANTDPNPADLQSVLAGDKRHRSKRGRLLEIKSKGTGATSRAH